MRNAYTVVDLTVYRQDRKTDKYEDGMGLREEEIFFAFGI